MFVTTDEINDGGDVIMVVYGDKGNSGPIVLGKATDSGLFSAGNLDEFKVVMHSFPRRHLSVVEDTYFITFLLENSREQCKMFVLYCTCSLMSLM